MWRSLGTIAIPLILLSGCAESGSDGSGGETVTVHVGGNLDNYVNEHPGSIACEFYDGTIREGDRVTLEGSGGEILGVTELAATDFIIESLNDPTTHMGYCEFEAVFEAVDTDHAAFTFQLASFGEVVASKDEITRDPLTMTPRSTFGVLAGDTEPLTIDEAR